MPLLRISMRMFTQFWGHAVPFFGSTLAGPNSCPISSGKNWRHPGRAPGQPLAPLGAEIGAAWGDNWCHSGQNLAPPSGQKLVPLPGAHSVCCLCPASESGKRGCGDQSWCWVRVDDGASFLGRWEALLAWGCPQPSGAECSGNQLSIRGMRGSVVSASFEVALSFGRQGAHPKW